MSIESGRITANSTSISNLSSSTNSQISNLNSTINSIHTSLSNDITGINTTISTAGWINSAQGNTLYAAKTFENGNTMISYINQAAGSTTISSSKINLLGAVTFSAFDSSLQSTINGKANSNSLGGLTYLSSVASGNLSTALKSYIDGKADATALGTVAYLNSIGSTNLSTALQNSINNISNKVDSSALGALAYLSSIGSDRLNTALYNLITGKQDASALKSLAFLDKVGLSFLDSTVVVGGYIKTTLIDTDSIYANMAKIGGWNIANNRLESDADSAGYKLILNATNRRISMTRVNENVAALVIALNDQQQISGQTTANPSIDIMLRDPSNNAVSCGTKLGATGLVHYVSNSGITYFSIQGNMLYMPYCPTSSSGLYAGQVYRDGNTLKIV